MPDDIQDDTQEIQNDSQDEKIESRSIEDDASARGWTDKENWDGDPGMWVDAPQFLRNGELMDRISDQTRQIKSQDSRMGELREAIESLGDHNRKMAKVEYSKALKDLKQAKSEALAIDDHDAIVEIDDRISDLKEDKAVLDKPAKKASSEVQPSQEIIDWQNKNSWYNNNSTMHGAADAIAYAYVQANPNLQGDVANVLRHVDSEMRREFPQKFSGRQRAGGPSDSGAGRVSGKSKAGLTGRLSDEQRKIGMTFVQSGAFKKLEDYAGQLDELGELA